MARKVIDDTSEDVVANARKDRAGLTGPLGRISLFIRQVFGELRKVVAPTRKELFSFTAVVLVFVVFMMLIVSGLDFVFSALVNVVFGDASIGG